MTTARRNAINTMADKIFEHFKLSTPITIKTLEDVVKKFGGSIESKIFDEELTSGEIKAKNADNFVIYYSATEDKKRNLFTIAHELGHYFLHLHDENGEFITEYIDSPFYRSGYSAEEYEANEFAAALLMPRKLFKQAIEENSDDNCVNIGAVADLFGVSISAAKNRGKWLGFISW